MTPKSLAILKPAPRSRTVGRYTRTPTHHTGIHSHLRKGRSAGPRNHDLRTSHARLFEKGLNVMEAAAVTGHKTLEMLKRYTHLRAKDLAVRMAERT